MIENKVSGEGFTLNKKLLFFYVSEQRRTIHEFRDTLSEEVDGSESQMLSSAISRRMLTDTIEQQLHTRLHDPVTKSTHSTKSLMCQEDC